MKNLSKILLIFIAFFGIFIANTYKVDAAAAKCQKGFINKYINGQGNFTSEQIQHIITCSCEGWMGDKETSQVTSKSGVVKVKMVETKRYDNCNAMRTAYATSGTSLTNFGTSYHITKPMKVDTARYAAGMSSVVILVKALLNTLIGITLFILGFGFLWNISQMGIHSSNPMARQACLTRLGDIFATAIYIGLIPLIVQFVTSVITQFQ